VCLDKATRIPYLVARWKRGATDNFTSEVSKSRLVKIKSHAVRPISRPNEMQHCIATLTNGRPHT
jgi:hypothetical protein